MPDDRGAETANTVSGNTGAVVQAGSISGDVHVHAPEPSVVTPHELPPAISQFTDRTEYLAELDLLLGAVDEPSSSAALVISAVSGTAGVGKTAFVTHWAHRVSDRFPDGQLYVNLHGYGPQDAVEAPEALAGFLRSLGVPNSDIPHDVDERAARFRSLAAGRKMLIVLDNARSAEQVRLLLPGTSSCLVLVTSRDSLPGLVSRDGARRVNLDLLPVEQAITLLRNLLGERVDDEPEAAAALVRHCGRLPLALRIAAELAVEDPEAGLSELVDDLTDEQSRLDLLDAGDDPYTAVRAVLSWSYTNLEPEAARAFRLLGLHPGRDFDLFGAAALLGEPAARARRKLALLLRAHLVEHGRFGRYQMHDLLRVYAADIAATEESDEDRRAALTRLFDYYVCGAATAMDVLFPHERDRRPEPPMTANPILTVKDREHALAWLEAERPTLLAVAAYTADGEWAHSYPVLMSETIHRYLDSRSYFDEAVTLHTNAVAVARRAGTVSGEGRALRDLGVIYQRLGRYAEALDQATRALPVIRGSGDRHGEAFALKEIGFVRFLLGQYDEAMDCLRQALEILRAVGDRLGQGGALNEMALVHGRLHQFQEAVEELEQALAIFVEAGDQIRQGYALNDLGMVRQKLGHHDEALTYHQKALDIARGCGDRSLAAAALNGIGNTARATGDPIQALERHGQALELAAEIRDRYEQAQAHEGLASGCVALDRHAEARDHWRAALSIYTELGAPEAEEVAGHLAEPGEERSAVRGSGGGTE